MHYECCTVPSIDAFRGIFSGIALTLLTYSEVQAVKGTLKKQ